MGSRKKKKNSGRKSTAAPPKQKFSLKWIVLIVAVAAGAAGLIIYHFGLTEPDQTPVSEAGESKSGQTARIEFHKLIGRWLRPDGGYVIDIGNISTGGTMEAAYFNPRSINVSRAEVSRKKGSLEVFIELRDTGYPGSTYTLTYNPQQDMLTGIYYQATIGQSFEVIFVRTQ
jgi:hypothetical protein